MRDVTSSPDRSRWLALVVLCAGMLMIILDGTIVNVALPSIRDDLGFSQTSLAWVVNAYLLTFGGFLLLGGRLGDLFGHRRLFLIGVSIFTAASLACGVASSQGMLIGARAVQGVGGAIVSAVALSLLMTLFTGQADRAISITRHTLGPDGSGLPLDAFWLGGAALFAGVAAAAGAVDLLTLLYALLEGCADHVVIFGAGGAVLGSGHHWLGVLAAGLGKTDAALDHLAEATAIAKALDAPYWVAASSIEGAAALRARDRADDASRADRLIAEAIAIAEPQGYGRVLTRARVLR